MVYIESISQTFLSSGSVEGADAPLSVSSSVPSITWNSCGSWSPLADPHGNSLSPCFVSAIFGITTFLCAIPALFQLVESLFYRENKGSLSLKSTNVMHYLRSNSVLLQGVLYLFAAYELNVASDSLFDIRVAGFGIAAALILLVFLPLHFVEVKSRIIPSASLLIFWPLNAILNSAIVFQQIFSSVKILETKYIEFLLLYNSVVIFCMEYLKWAPTEELVEYYKANDISMEEYDVVSRMTFSYVNPLMVQGVTSKSITDDDVFEPLDIDSTAVAAKKLGAYWSNQQKKKRPALGLAVFASIALTAALSIFLEFLENVLSFVQPQLLRLLIRFFNSDADTPLIVGFSIAAGMFVVSVLRTSIFNKYFILNFEAAMRAKAGLMSLIYAKALKLSPEARSMKTTGEIVNLMSVDVGRVQDVGSYAQQLISAPIKLILALVSLHQLLGNALWGGVFVMFVMIGLNSVLIKYMRKLHKQQMIYKDKRSKLVNEILTSMKSIKLYSWENTMLERLRHVRNNEELKNLKTIGCFSACVNFSWDTVPFFVSCASFSLFAYFSSTPLTSDLIFPALSLFDLLGEPIFALPATITGLIELNIALGRMTSFLLSSETDDSFITKLDKVNHNGDVSLFIKNATFLWSKPANQDESTDDENDVASPKLALKDVDFEARKGELSCVVGRVGSGKSTFMQAILGELPCYPSDVTKPVEFIIKGDVAYCSQVPWIMNASVKENILFGKRYEDDFYQKTIKACQLLDDLEVLPDGDDTMVGEKGISLSGGQKARISLARAVYKRADIYLLDDILSAVDAHVGKHITDEVLGSQGLLASKTIILATNSVPILSHSKNIILLDHGEIKERGSFKEVVSAKSGLYDLINEYGRSQEENGELQQPVDEVLLGISSDETVTDDEEKFLEEFDGAGLISKASELPALERAVSHVTLRRPSTATFRRVPLNLDKDIRKTAQDAEKMEIGGVQWSVYKAYAKACSYTGVALFLTFIVGAAAFSVAGNYWLKKWSEANNKSGSNEHVGMFVGVYALFGVTAGLCVFLNVTIMWLFCTIRGSMALHDDMAKSIMRAPMSFFETTPIGRIMNRFSSDISKIDDYIPRTMLMFFSNGMSTVFTIAVISFSMPAFLLVMAVLSFLYIYFQKFFMATSRQLKRMQSVSLSPIFAHLQETLNGRDTILAYNEEERFKFLSAAHIDYNMKMFYAIRAVNRWLATRLQFIGSLIIFFASSMAILSRLGDKPMSSGMVGLVMSYALQITTSLNWMVRLTVEVETSIVSVERVLEYSKLKSEAPLVIEHHRPPAYWPSEGTVKFDHYSTKYRAKLEPVLNDISLEIRPEEKIGIVGRTGAGKSTLAASIYRLIEPTEGHIDIDGINTSDIGLFDLRHKLSIIPQDSQILEGTVRQNLDPMDEYTDEQLWASLKLSHLEDVINTMSTDETATGLQSKLNEGGSNLSVGQRQLICLARALLNPSKILILDEATAAVDVQTDKILQETIRTEFKDKTILTIAHRLDTVMDSDRIVVLDKGRVKEFDTPANLLNDTSSIFYSLCQQGGYLNNNNME